MSDRMYAEIHIGGSLYRRDLEEFIELACSANRDEKVDEAWLLRYAKENDTDGEIILRDPEVAWGKFEDLEKFCEDHDLTYRRETEGKYEYDPETAYWTPGMKEALCMVTSRDGNATVQVGTLRHEIGNLKKFLKKVNKIEKAPLHINDKDPQRKAWAKHILSQNKIDPLDLLSIWISSEYPDTGSIPPFVIKE